MRRDLIMGSVIIVVIGIVVFFLSVIKVPYASTVEVPKSEVSLDESFTVSALSHEAYYVTTSTFPHTLQITFTVTEGGNKDIDFSLMDEVEYWKFRAEESYKVYSVPTRERVTSLNIEWTPPPNKKIYFVWDNSFSWFTTKSVSAKFYFNWTELEETTKHRTLFPSEMSYIGVLVLIGGLIGVGYGFASKPSSVI